MVATRVLAVMKAAGAFSPAPVDPAVIYTALLVAAKVMRGQVVAAPVGGGEAAAVWLEQHASVVDTNSPGFKAALAAATPNNRVGDRVSQDGGANATPSHHWRCAGCGTEAEVTGASEDLTTTARPPAPWTSVQLQDCRFEGSGAEITLNVYFCSAACRERHDPINGDELRPGGISDRLHDAVDELLDTVEAITVAARAVPGESRGH